ncbi:MAG: hypothetical protein ACLFPL_05055 [Candidatus Nanoarchaeia archaeon]
MKQLYQFIRNKQGVELSLTLIVEMIIAIIVLIVLILFFTGGFSENFPTIIGAGESGIDKARGE